ncbi:MAG TPA: hypothetical protein VM290_12000 [Gaiellaceae bacterium]|nr:hypothetical protein [Gaiellaceae bacterium]
MRTLLVPTALAALVVAGAAAAGGFATAGISPLPDGSATWEPTVTIRAHGVTPMDGLDPVLTIRNRDTGEVRRFSADPVGSGGQYRFRVEFPSGGTWEYTVADGYAGQVHTFAPVQVGAPAPAAAPDARGSLAWTIGGAAALLGALALLLVVGRRARSSAPATAAG